ncbi:MAG: hypothetical protein MHM6MM_009666 [Cercozoa sp. M6MM]
MSTVSLPQSAVFRVAFVCDKCKREKQLRDCGIPNFFAPHRKQLHEVLRVVQCVCRKRRVSEIQDETGLGKDFIRSVKKHVFQVMYMAEVAREKQKKMSGLTEVDEMGVGQPKFHIGHRGRLAGTMWVLTFTEVSETTRGNGTKNARSKRFAGRLCQSATVARLDGMCASTLNPKPSYRPTNGEHTPSRRLLLACSITSSTTPQSAHFRELPRMANWCTSTALRVCTASASDTQDG